MRGIRWTDEHTERAVKMRLDGVYWLDIAKQLGCSVNTVQKHVNAALRQPNSRTVPNRMANGSTGVSHFNVSLPRVRFLEQP